MTDQCSFLPASNRHKTNNQVTMKTQETIPSLAIDHGICDEILAAIISFLDFKSAVIFTNRTSRSIRKRILGTSSLSTSSCNASGCSNSYLLDTKDSPQSRCFDELWRDIYHRHHFCPMEVERTSLSRTDSTTTTTTASNRRRTRDSRDVLSGGHLVTASSTGPCVVGYDTELRGKDYIDECRQRLELLDNLTHEKKCHSDSRLSTTTRSSQKLNNSRWGDLSRRRHFKVCSSLPSRCFRFLPIVPNLPPLPPATATTAAGLDDPDAWDNAGALDFPPVDFPCSSYLLTSPGVDGEYVLLNPFNGQVEVFSDISESISRNPKENRGSSKEILFSVQDYFHLDLQEYFYPRHHTNTGNGTSSRLAFHPSAPIGLSQDEEVVVDWMGVDVHNLVDEHGNIGGTMVCAAREISTEVDHPPRTTNVRGNARPVALWNGLDGDRGRANMFDDHEVKSCTELMAWKKRSKVDKYSNERYTCRLDGSPYYIEMCPVTDRVYVCFSPGSLYNDDLVMNATEMSTARIDGDHAEENMDVDDGVEEDMEGDFWTDDVMGIKRSRLIRVFPLLRHWSSTDCPEATSQSGKRRFFPEVQVQFCCKNPVTSLAVEPTGEHLIVGTENGAIEVWDVRSSNDTPIPLQQIDISCHLKSITETSVLQSERDMTAVHGDSEIISVFNTLNEGRCLQIGHASSSSTASSDDNSEQSIRRRGSYSSTLDPLNDYIMQVEDSIQDYLDTDHIANSDTNEPEPDMDIRESASYRPLCQCNTRRMVNEIVISRHLTIKKAGFFTLQHHRDEGTTLVFWQFNKDSHSFQMSSLINLPLSTQRRPKVLYDGKKLVVFGQDHIGLIILIYRVLSSPEDKVCSLMSSLGQGGSDNSGGVLNLNGVDSIVYMNRIRSAGLGGIEFYDNIFMTMNERYIIVNTKTGNLLGNGHRETDGLLVIDLKL